MKIKIYTTTKNKNKSHSFHIDMLNEYVKRLSKYAKCEVFFGKKLKKVSKNTKVFLLDTSKTNCSEYLAEQLNTLTVIGFSEIVFLSDITLLDTPELNINDIEAFSVSTMNFSELTTVSVLLEQIYRGYKILNNENYHK